MWLRYIKELSYREIVWEMQAPLGTVKIWLYRGRHQLKRALEKQEAGNCGLTPAEIQSLQQRAMWLRYIKELSYREIVWEMQAPLGTVSGNLASTEALFSAIS